MGITKTKIRVIGKNQRMKGVGNIHAVNGRHYEKKPQKNQDTLQKARGSGMGREIHCHGRTLQEMEGNSNQKRGAL